MADDKLQQFLLRQGSDPKQSVKTFISGLVLFIVALGLLYAGVDLHHSVQIIGLVLMAFALAIAAKGYLGIVSNRIAFFRHQAHKNRNKYKHLK